MTTACSSFWPQTDVLVQFFSGARQKQGSVFSEINTCTSIAQRSTQPSGLAPSSNTTSEVVLFTESTTNTMGVKVVYLITTLFSFQPLLEEADATRLLFEIRLCYYLPCVVFLCSLHTKKTESVMQKASRSH